MLCIIAWSCSHKTTDKTLKTRRDWSSEVDVTYDDEIVIRKTVEHTYNLNFQVPDAHELGLPRGQGVYRTLVYLGFLFSTIGFLIPSDHDGLLWFARAQQPALKLISLRCDNGTLSVCRPDHWQCDHLPAECSQVGRNIRTDV